MPRKAVLPVLTVNERKMLERISRSGKEEHRIVWRANLVLACADNRKIVDIAVEYHTRPNTVIKWRDRFKADGIAGLHDAPRSGKPKTYPDDLREKVIAILNQDPPSGYAVWNGPLIADRLNASKDKVWNILKKEGIQLQRHRSWCVSTDPEFTGKSADIVGLYINPPDNAIVISIDEKPGIQALQRTTGYVETRSGKIVRAYKSTYKRNGTLNLFAALNVAAGSIKAKTTGTKKRLDFLEFMDDLLHDLPERNHKDQDVRVIHVILDNYCTHKRCDEWLLKHPDVKFHYTPTSTSWLNQVEIWLSIFSRSTLKGASFENTDQLAISIEDYVREYNKHPMPFKWRKREVKGSQIRDTIITLRN